MNWMTSTRKRVQRSHKGRELRAKHFAKVAADRARAPVSTRAVRSSSTRQSTDVSLLKSRWTQHPPAARTEQASAQTNSSCPPSDVATLGPRTTPEASPPFKPGTLELEVTPPFGAERSYGGSGVGGGGGGGSGAERGARAVASDVSSYKSGGGTLPDGGGDDAFERPYKQPRRHHQQPLPHLMSALPPAEPNAPLLHHARGPLERRQLVFGGSGSAAAQHDEFGEDYEGQLLGSDGADVVGHSSEARQTATPPGRKGLALEGRGAGGAVAGATDLGRDVGQQGRLRDQWGGSMRFFDAGVEVALDGSPVLDNDASSPQPPQLSASSCSGRFTIRSNDRNGVGASSGVAGATRGLPQFCVGGGKALVSLDKRMLATPPELREEMSQRDVETDAISVSDLAHSASSHANAENLQVQPAAFEPVDDRAESPLFGENLHEFEGHNALEEEHGRSPPTDEPPAAAAGFEMVAQSWGLFGGAFASSPSRGTNAVGNPCTFHGMKGDGDDYAKDPLEAAVEEIARGDGHHDGASGSEGGMPRLQVSGPAPSTHSEAGIAGHHAEASNGPEVRESPPPPSPATSLPPPSGGDHDHHHLDLDDCSSTSSTSSPELTMTFIEEPRQGEDTAVAARRAEDKASGEEPQKLSGHPKETSLTPATAGSQDQIAPEDSPRGHFTADSSTNHNSQEKVNRLHQPDQRVPQKKENLNFASNTDHTDSAEMLRDVANDGHLNTCGLNAAGCLPEPPSSKVLAGSGAVSATSRACEPHSPKENAGDRDGGGDGDGKDGGGGSSSGPLSASQSPPVPRDHLMEASDVQPSSAETDQVSDSTTSTTKTSEDGRKARLGPAAALADLTLAPSSCSGEASTAPQAQVPQGSTRTNGAGSSCNRAAAAVVVHRERRKRSRQEKETKEAREEQRPPRKGLRTTDGEAGVGESRKVRRGKSMFVAALFHAMDGSGGGGGGGNKANEGKCRPGAGFDAEGEHALSSIAWYRTIVACVTAAET